MYLNRGNRHLTNILDMLICIHEGQTMARLANGEEVIQMSEFKTQHAVTPLDVK